jgi:hypothetical protein
MHCRLKFYVGIFGYYAANQKAPTLTRPGFFPGKKGVLEPKLWSDGMRGLMELPPPQIKNLQYPKFKIIPSLIT